MQLLLFLYADIPKVDHGRCIFNSSECSLSVQIGTSSSAGTDLDYYEIELLGTPINYTHFFKVLDNDRSENIITTKLYYTIGFPPLQDYELEHLQVSVTAHDVCGQHSPEPSYINCSRPKGKSSKKNIHEVVAGKYVYADYQKQHTLQCSYSLVDSSLWILLEKTPRDIYMGIGFYIIEPFINNTLQMRHPVEVPAIIKDQDGLKHFINISSMLSSLSSRDPCIDVTAVDKCGVKNSEVIINCFAGIILSLDLIACCPKLLLFACR